METTAKVFRHNGQWVIELPVEDWVISDILFDNDRGKSVPVKVVIRKDFSEYGGTTYRAPLGEAKNVTEPISADVKFRVENVGTDSE